MTDCVATLGSSLVNGVEHELHWSQSLSRYAMSVRSGPESIAPSPTYISRRLCKGTEVHWHWHWHVSNGRTASFSVILYSIDLSLPPSPSSSKPSTISSKPSNAIASQNNYPINTFSKFLGPARRSPFSSVQSLHTDSSKPSLHLCSLASRRPCPPTALHTQAQEA